MAKPSTTTRRGRKADPSEEEDGSPELLPSEDDSEEEEDDDDDGSVYDSEDGLENNDADDDGSEDDDGFEDQGSSDEDDDLLERQQEDDDSDDDDGAVNDIALSYENQGPRSWKLPSETGKKNQNKSQEEGHPKEEEQKWLHADDWSSDEDDGGDGKQNRIGKVPLHWYDDYEHIGYDAHGSKVAKGASSTPGEGGDRIDQALAMQDNLAAGKFVVHDALNDRNVELSQRQLELIRRVQAGAYAHPEHDAYPPTIDYFSGVDPEISGLNSDKYEPKARFQPSQWDKLQVDRLLEKLKNGSINMDYLTGKIRDMNDAKRPGQGDPNKPYLLWTGDEEDELNLRKGPQHIAAPKLPPPGHAMSYVPPDEYLPTAEDLQKWAEMEPRDRPHGHVIPKKFPNLRSVGAYQHSVQEAFERCLDLYLCPRLLKRRLNIDPESLVPRLPRAADLRPFPTAKAIEYRTPYDEGSPAPAIRCVTPSPDGQFLASGASDGFVRLWEVQTGRLLRSWDLSALVLCTKVNPAAAADEIVAAADGEDSAAVAATAVKPVVALLWNPNRSHHCLLAAVGNCVVVIATGTAGRNDAEITHALLASASRGGSGVTGAKAQKAVQWIGLGDDVDDDNNSSSDARRPVSASYRGAAGPICALRMAREVASIRWQSKGDYFVSVSRKAGAAAVLVHQLSKGNTQQPFSKAGKGGEPQLACFHPNKPFLFVASQQHVRVYHLVKQNMVKRLASGCRWISSIDVHPTGDHLIVGTLDRRMVWFDLDLGATPYRTLKYHERAIRSCAYHGRYPLLASASDDGAVHVFHGMVYSDLMRNPLIVPVKILRGHSVTNKLGVLSVAFHPTQPWIFTAGADGKIILFQDI